MIFLFKDNASIFGVALVFAFSLEDAKAALKRNMKRQIEGRFALWKTIEVPKTLKEYYE